ncbi:unnamed protein product [Vitrella brassicaformis CCMP3155]|uniref:Uncharacterized protein n=1 Tax=Vitrella brassicaformis (strain CCMP3155) TaxID=1169540 RepID=A0A0G4FUF0_VITBC|nr:unnamed protein product [Vitrella brassicaformis CCMP3155]|eukprot:CEM18170.1 unnamed protein product [Vitrella brassicaformis CCMP3155]
MTHHGLCGVQVDTAVLARPACFSPSIPAGARLLHPRCDNGTDGPTYHWLRTGTSIAEVGYVSEHYREGKTFLWSTFVSTRTSKAFAERWGGTLIGGEAQLIFKLRETPARDVKGHYRRKELYVCLFARPARQSVALRVILPPFCCRFRVVSTSNSTASDPLWPNLGPMDAMMGVDAKDQKSAEKKAKKEEENEKGKLQKRKKSDEDTDAPAASKKRGGSSVLSARHWNTLRSCDADADLAQ